MDKLRCYIAYLYTHNTLKEHIRNRDILKFSKIEEKSWMKQCLNELVEVDRAGFSGRNICNCLWDKLETPWFDASSVYETKNAATICSLQEMKKTMPY